MAKSYLKKVLLQIKKDKNRLHMAMLDPKDMKAVDEFRFISGYDIIPYALSIFFRLTKYILLDSVTAFSY